MKLRKLLFLALMCAALCQPFAVHAQFDSASVLGYVHDQTGAAVSNSKIVLVNEDTGDTRETLSDSQGAYEFPDVKIGRYHVRSEARGFNQTTTAAFTVTVAARQRVDVALTVGSTSQTVEVSGAASQLETDSSNRGQVINHEAIVQLPLNGRAYANLALLSPGVRESTLLSLKGRDASFNVNGMRSAYNNFILDGVDNNAYGTSNQGYSNQLIRLAPDAVQEFRIDTDNYSAEYGRAAGAVINATVRSGTNAFHGSAWEFARNTALNATGYFKPATGKPTLVQNQFGGAFGGPFQHNRIFFFADYEGFRSDASQISFLTVPTLAERAGLFTRPIQNPYSGAVYADGQIPSSVLAQYPFGSTVLNNLPAPNASGSSNNLSVLVPISSPGNKGDFRYDQVLLPDRLSVFGRFSTGLNYVYTSPSLNGPSGPGTDVTRTYNRQVALGATWTINPRSILDVRLGLDRTEGSDGKSEELNNSQSMLALYGITGLPTNKPISGGLNLQTISGFAQMGRDSGQHQYPGVINPKANYSWVAGLHTLKAGFEFQSIGTEIVDFNPMYGADTYAGQFSRPTGASNSTLYNVADFLMGARDTYTLNSQGVAHYIQKMYFGYLQDDWRLNRKLTLNLGLRYEFATPQYERDNKLSNFDPTTKQMILASSGSLYNRALVNPDPWNLGPRVGVAYSITPKTVIRSAYGIGYMHFNRYGGENLLAYNEPFVLSASVTQQPSQGLCTNDLNPAGCFRPTQMGYPTDFASPANANPAAVKIHYAPKDTKSSKIESWHVTVQHELASNLILDVAYVGNRGSHILMLADYNQATPNAAGQNVPLSARRPVPAFGIIEINFDGGYSNYNALQVRLEKRYSTGLYLLNSFTWSKAIDNGSGSMETSAGDDYPLNYANWNYTKGLSGFNQPLNDTTTVIWDLPFGRQRKFFSSAPRWENAILGGWQTAFINTMNSGLPVNFKYDPSSAQTVSSMPIYRPNLVGDVNRPAGGRTVQHYFNAAALSIPSISAPFGNAGRNIARGPAYYNLDFSMHKSFALPIESSQLEIRSEFFNLLNKTNFQAPASDVSSSSFGSITSTFPARQIQFGVKLLF